MNNVLPHSETIFNWYRSVNGEPEISSEAMKLLELKTKQQSNTVVALMMDEIKIHEHTLMDLMVSSMDSRWKMPVAHFFISSLTNEQKTELLLNCIR